MFQNGPAPRQWPPVDLIAGLSLETTAYPESKLDENVHSRKFYPRSIALSSIILVPRKLFLHRESNKPQVESFLQDFSKGLSLTLGRHLELPPGSKVLKITPAGASAWVQTVRIRTCQESGTTRDYFKKVSVMCMCYEGNTWSDIMFPEPKRHRRSKNNGECLCV